MEGPTETIKEVEIIKEIPEAPIDYKYMVEMFSQNNPKNNLKEKIGELRKIVESTQPNPGKP